MLGWRAWFLNMLWHPNNLTFFYSKTPAKLKEENAQLKNMVDAALNERDFYFGKLRLVLKT